MRSQTAALAMLVAVAAVSLFLYFSDQPSPPSGILAEIPQSIGQWRGIEGAISDREKEILGTEDILCVHYSGPGGKQARLLIVIAHQASRRSHPPEQCYEGEGYRCEAARAIPLDVPTGQGESLRVRELLYEKSDNTRLVWYFFKNGSQLNTSYWGHQAKVALARLLGKQAVDILIRVDTPLGSGSVDDARADMRDFLNVMMPHLINKLP